MNKALILVSLIITFLALTPLLESKLFYMHDFTHAARLAEMDTALKDGNFPVRWSPNLGYGYGMPLFNFYAPLFYYIAEFFHLSGISIISSLKLTIFLNFFASFISMYYFTKNFWGKWGGLLSATAFIYIPYRAVDLYVRGALAELTAITFLSLSLLGLYNLSKSKNYYWFIFTSFSLAGIFLSHNLITLISFPFLAVISLYFLFQVSPKRENFKLVLYSFITGLSLSAFYILPAFFEKKYSSADKLITNFSDFHHHFVSLKQFIHSPWGYGGSVLGPIDGMTFEIGKMHLILLILVLFIYQKLQKKDKLFLVFISSMSLVSLFFASYYSRFIWENVSLMAYIQFPWRFLSLTIILVSILTGSVVKLFSKSFEKAAALSLIIALIIYYNPIFKPQNYSGSLSQLYRHDSDHIKTEISQVIPDFVNPKLAGNPAPPKKRFLVEPDSEIEVLENKTNSFKLRANNTQNSVLTLNIFDFPKWVIKVNGMEVQYRVKEDFPVMNLNLPDAAEVVISGKLHDTPLRTTANTISLLAFLSLTYLFFKKRYETHSH